MPRLPLDAYMTPPHYVAALLGEVNVCGRVLEPCSGDGSISDALRSLSVVKHVETNDIDPARAADHNLDAREGSLLWIGAARYDWCVTNPPFSDELPILEQAIEHVPNVAFLARLSFLEPTEDREYFLDQHPPTQVIVLPRYSFRLNDDGKKATDSVTCCWLVWHADRQPRWTKSWGRAKALAYAEIRGLNG